MPRLFPDWIRWFISCACLILYASPITAQEESSDENETLFSYRPILAINEFFDTQLPGTLDKFNLSLEFRPRFSDLIRREFIRFPFVLRYGATDRIEIGALLTPIAPNPFRAGSDRRWSPGEAGALIRMDFDPILRIWDHATLEVVLRQPLGRPPAKLIDGYTRLQPVLSVSRTAFIPELVAFANLSYDYALGSWGRAKPSPDHAIRQNVMSIGPGLLYKPDELGYFIAYRLKHIDEPQEFRWAHVYHIGVVWEIPLARSRSWKLPGHWQVEAGYRLTDEQQRSIAHAITLRVRWRGDLKALFKREPMAVPEHRSGNNGVHQFIPR